VTYRRPSLERRKRLATNYLLRVKAQTPTAQHPFLAHAEAAPRPGHTFSLARVQHYRGLGLSASASVWHARQDAKPDEVNVLRLALATHGGKAQIQMAVEECAELIVAAQHRVRGRSDDAALISEVADVTIMMRQLRLLLGPAAVDRAIDAKVNRLAGRLQAVLNERAKHEPPTERPTCPGCRGDLAGLVDTACDSCLSALASGFAAGEFDRKRS